MQLQPPYRELEPRGHLYRVTVLNTAPLWCPKLVLFFKVPMKKKTTSQCSYMSVTCHINDIFTVTSSAFFSRGATKSGKRVAKELLRVAKEWQVDDSVVLCY